MDENKLEKVTNLFYTLNVSPDKLVNKDVLETAHALVKRYNEDDNISIDTLKHYIFMYKKAEFMIKKYDD